MHSIPCHGITTQCLSHLLCALQLDEVEFAQQRRQFAAQHRTDWEAAKVSKDRLAKMLPHKEEFQEQIMKRRADEFAALKVGIQRTLK